MDDKTIARGSFISRSESLIVQGIAVLLMVWHHLFGFPERIHVPYMLVLDGFTHIETILSYFGRICIAMFAFSSGYGMQKKALQITTYRFSDIGRYYCEVFQRLLKLYKKYWGVFLVFVPLGLILGVYTFDINIFIKGLVGFTSIYNAEWWYLREYIILILVFPVLTVILDFLESRHQLVMNTAVLLTLIVSITSSEVRESGMSDVLCYFLEGIWCVRSNIFEKVSGLLKYPSVHTVVGFIMVCVVFVGRTLGIPDYILIPFMVFGIVSVFKNRILLATVGKSIIFTGKYSTCIWLTHTFFAYYYFQKFTYFPFYSWLIFLWCVLLCIAYGFAYEKIAEGIRKYLKLIPSIQHFWS